MSTQLADIRASRQLDLNGTWELAWTKPGKELLPDQKWIEANVPGEVHLDLHKAGVIPDPYFGTNFMKCQWMERTDFWYRTSFTVPQELEGDRYVLTFEGLDNFADIWLDQKKIASTRNMFITHEMDISDQLRPGQSHELIVRLSGPISYVNRDHFPGLPIDVSAVPSIFNMPWRHYTRKMQMSYGWDNVPRLPTIGVFRPVYIQVRKNSYVQDAHIQCAIGDRFAKVTVDAEIAAAVRDRSAAAREPAELQLAIKDRDEQIVAAKTVFLPNGGNGEPTRTVRVSETFEIENPRLWWPYQMGEPHLYRLEIAVRQGGETQDRYTARFGIRTIKVITEPVEEREVHYRVGNPEGFRTLEMDGGDAGAWSRLPLEHPVKEQVAPFRFEVNGQPIFIKGVNWQPADCFLPAVTKQKYEVLLRRVKEANLNCVRVWGGGIVEDDMFYDLCDELGVLVWQDFFFACALYPQEDWFAEEIRTEAAFVIRKLRNRACLAIWCGDNEGDMFNVDRGRDPVQANRLTHRVIPDLLGKLDPSRFYHPSSPSGGSYPRSPWSGDKRNWGAFYPANFYDHIRHDEGRFISEGGSYSLPGMRTIERSIPEQERWPVEDSESWYYHLGNVPGHVRGFHEKMSDYVRTWFGEPRNLEDYIWLSQYAQGNGYKAFAEHFRRRKADCGGFQIWKYCDTWPSGEMTVVDYCLENKLSYYYLKRACSPLLLTFKYVEDGFEWWIVNDRQEAWKGRLEISLLHLVSGQSEVLSAQNVTAGADSAGKHGKAGWHELNKAAANDYVLVGKLIEEGRVVERNLQFITDCLKNLHLPEPAADLQVGQSDGQVKITVRARTFIRNVGIAMKESDPAQITYSDNHFAMLPGEQVEIAVSGAIQGDQPEIRID